MKKKTRRLLTLALGTVCIVSTVLLLRAQADKSTGEDAYSTARALAAASAVENTPASTHPAVQPDTANTVWIPAPVENDPNMEELSALTLDGLQEVNPDVVGWVRIPDTPIDYPIVQGEDNEYYLHYTWDGQKSSVGSIFLECTNQADMTEFHTILYGHNMLDKSMFASLRNYASIAYWQKRPYVYLVTPSGVLRYEIYASYWAEVESNTYALGIQSEGTKQDFIDLTTGLSTIETGVIPAVTDRILTLSTCTGMGYATRCVVHARLPMVEATE